MTGAIPLSFPAPPPSACPTGHVELGRRSYGKRGVRFLDLRDGAGQGPSEFVVDVAVRGGLPQAYLGLGNSEVVPSDALRETVLAGLARLAGEGAGTAELAQDLAQEVLAKFPWLPAVVVTVTRAELFAVARNGPDLVYVRETAPAPDGTVRQGCATRRQRVVLAHQERSAGEGQGPPLAAVRTKGAVRRLGVVLSGSHQFAGYHGAPDGAPGPLWRVLLGTLSCKWEWAPDADAASSPRDVLRYLLPGLATRSESVQHLIASAAAQLLASRPELQRVRLTFRSAPTVPLGPVDSSGRPAFVLAPPGHPAVTSTTVARRQAGQTSRLGRHT